MLRPGASSSFHPRAATITAGAIASLVLSLDSPAFAIPVVVDSGASDHGTFCSGGSHDPGNNTSQAGLSNCDGSGSEARAYFGFNLGERPDLDGVVVTSAELVLSLVFLRDANLNPLPPTSTTTFPFTVYDVGTPRANFDLGYANGSATGITIFIDLGTGSPFAQGIASIDFVGGLLPSMSISSQGVADINGSLNDWFILGVALDAAGGNVDFTSGLGGVAQLNLEVTPIPEPTTALLFATGLTALAVRRRRLH